MLNALIERLAPHWPAEDQAEDGPDTRSFWRRLHDADAHRSENPNTIWARDYGTSPWAEINTCWQFTQPGLGVDVSWEHGGPQGRQYGYPSSLNLLVALGFWSINLHVEWNYSTTHHY